MILYEQYADLFEEYGIKNIDITDTISKAWRENHRFYHTEAHLADLLTRIEQVPELNLEDKKILQTVAFFHDFIYEPTSQENEEKSVEKFKEIVPSHAHTKEICQIILDTKSHTPTSKLSEIFCKMDMAVVSESNFKQLLEWENQIFKEYRCYDYSTYKLGRTAVLQNFKEKYPQNAQNLGFLIEYLRVYRPKIGVYPGSFNPFHNGHLNILEKAEKVFDKVIIANGTNPEKQDNIKQDSAKNDHLKNKDTTSPVLKYRQFEDFKGLLTDYISSKETDAEITLIRGLRNGDDLSYEMNQLSFMRDMKPDLKTIFIHCDKEFEHISSSAIRNLEKIGIGYGNRYLP
jgi:pantetheine-phosphate adenylyltransferase